MTPRRRRPSPAFASGDARRPIAIRAFHRVPSRLDARPRAPSRASRIVNCQMLRCRIRGVHARASRRRSPHAPTRRSCPTATRAPSRRRSSVARAPSRALARGRRRVATRTTTPSSSGPPRTAATARATRPWRATHRGTRRRRVAAEPAGEDAGEQDAEATGCDEAGAR